MIDVLTFTLFRVNSHSVIMSLVDMCIGEMSVYTVYSGYSGHVYSGHSDVVAIFPILL